MPGDGRVADSAFRTVGLISLTTDFGLEQPYAGVMKACILRRLPGATLVDLTHGIPAHQVPLAGFWLARAWRYFPPGAVHLAVVDPAVGTDRPVLLAEAGGSVFLAPDNGLLAEALRGEPATFRRMDPGLPERLGLGPLSSTFHGRDLFAPLAAELAAGRLLPADTGPAAQAADPAPLPEATADDDVIMGHVILADRFGNLVTNIGGGLLSRLRQPVVEAGRNHLPLQATYAAAGAGAAVAIVNAWGLVELAVNGGRADHALGLATGARVRVVDGTPA